MFPYVFHVHDGIVHQRTDGDGHTAQAHRVDGQPHVVKHQNGDQQRKREGDQRDDRSAHVAQKEE